jgi:membrane-bound ClpP family serine protease
MLPILCIVLAVAAAVLLVSPELQGVLDANELPPRSGPESMGGEVGTVAKSQDGELWVLLRGERWRARIRGCESLALGDRVEVSSVEGMQLVVEPATAASRDLVPRATAGPRLAGLWLWGMASALSWFTLPSPWWVVFGVPAGACLLLLVLMLLGGMEG